MSKSNCEPALLSSLETLQHNLQDAGMLRMKASLYSEAAVREALGDSEYRRISEKLDRRALLAQLDAVSLFLLQVLGLVSVGEGDGDVKAVQSFLNEHDAGYIAEVTPEQPIIVEALGNKACVYVTKIVQCELRDVLRLLEAK